jgi:Rrf2 family iron-sulfur cluster assembly transcriptional regulator
MLSRTGEYALRAVLLMARQGNDSAMAAETIATELAVPRNYLSKTLNRLAKRGVLVSVRGPGGGFRLARPASELAVLDVVAEFEEMATTGACVMGGRECNPNEPCDAHEKWRSWSDKLSRLLEGTRVADLLPADSPAGLVAIEASSTVTRTGSNGGNGS